MAIIRDIMPAFELFQPATIDDTLRLLEPAWRGRLGDGRRSGHFRLVEGPHQAPQGGDRSEPGERAARSARSERRPRDRRHDHAYRSGAPSRGARKVQHPLDGRGGRGVAADPQPGHDRRQRLARTRAAGITAAAGNAIARAATSASPIRPPPSIASTPFWAPTAAWRSIHPTARRR